MGGRLYEKHTRVRRLFGQPDILRILHYKSLRYIYSEIIQIAKHGPLSRFKSVHKTLRQSFRRKKRTTEKEVRDGVRIEDLRPSEREIVQRPACPNVLGGETPYSLVRVTKFFRCNLNDTEGGPRGGYLFVGTYGGVILIHSLTSFTSAELFPLVREIRLQHRAPIVDIEHLPQAGRIVIFTEEQIRAFL